VSVCPPAYYAHLVAARARFHATGEGWNDEPGTGSLNSGGVVSEALRKGLRTSPSSYFGELGIGKILSYGKVKDQLKTRMFFM
jgi:hypothetical protein